ncbi:MAG TPA: quinohemoprotein amine dehydrogenase subunit alpha [Gemmatimonadales bacterium]
MLLTLTGAAGLTTHAVAQADPDRPAPVGIPVTNPIVIRQCSACHTRDSTGRMGRLSYMRKTPEGWQTSVRRMVSLNGVQLTPEAAREIVRYFSNAHGLAPEEARPGRFEVERRLIDHTYQADRDTETTCKACHSLGRVITQRRSKEEWELLVATHRAYYPVSDFQGFRRFGPPPDSGDRRHPMEKAIAHLAGAFPLDTREWQAWSATMRPPRLEGTWLLTGHEPGAGPLHGRMTIAPVPNSPDEFTSEATYVYARDGRQVTRRGRAIVYTGFQWRGRSTEGAGEDSALREVMFVERDWSEVSGRWFTGGYDEVGLDVTLRRLGRDPIVTGVEPRALRTGGSSQEVRVYGANFPASPADAAIDLGPGIRVTGVSGATPDQLTLQVRVDSSAKIGRRDVFVVGSHLKEAFTVYDTIHRIKVTPAAGMARVGGVVHPKQLQQFEAAAWHDGPDGKPNTADDHELGYVPVTWSLEEYTVTYDDDDVQFVGSLDQRGLFTPAEDGPNPRRSGNRNNVGDVWVVASFTPPGGGPPLRARAHLLVTVPLYIRFEPWRVAP